MTTPTKQKISVGVFKSFLLLLFHFFYAFYYLLHAENGKKSLKKHAEKHKNVPHGMRRKQQPK